MSPINTTEPLDLENLFLLFEKHFCGLPAPHKYINKYEK